MELLRAAETPQQRQERLEQNRTRNAEARAAETTQQREYRLEKNRTTMATSRAAEKTHQNVMIGKNVYVCSRLTL
jgi:hypothetical protein